MRPPKDLNDTDAKTLNVILNNEVVRRAYDLAQRFGCMIREHAHDQLDSWLSDSASSGVGELITFAKGIRADYAAIKAALTTKWSNGRTEGHIKSGRKTPVSGPSRGCPGHPGTPRRKWPS